MLGHHAIKKGRVELLRLRGAQPAPGMLLKCDLGEASEFA
jgi:hypothetical protein